MLYELDNDSSICKIINWINRPRNTLCGFTILNSFADSLIISVKFINFKNNICTKTSNRRINKECIVEEMSSGQKRWAQSSACIRSSCTYCCSQTCKLLNWIKLFKFLRKRRKMLRDETLQGVLSFVNSPAKGPTANEHLPLILHTSRRVIDPESNSSYFFYASNC